MVDGVMATYRTNFFMPNRWGLSLRVDPRLLMTEDELKVSTTALRRALAMREDLSTSALVKAFPRSFLVLLLYPLFLVFVFIFWSQAMYVMGSCYFPPLRSAHNPIGVSLSFPSKKTLEIVFSWYMSFPTTKQPPSNKDRSCRLIKRTNIDMFLDLT